MKKTINLAKEIKKREEYNLMTPFPFYDTEVIEDIKKLAMITKKDDYNNVYVTYCKTCLSLHVKDVTFPRKDKKTGEAEKDVEIAYCVPCGNTELDSAHISEWEDMYEEKYNERFLTKKS
jgi:hypothetical protein